MELFGPEKLMHFKHFDYVFVSIPPPQFISDVHVETPIEDNLLKKLSKVSFSSRFALIKYFDGDELQISEPSFCSNFLIGYWSNGRIRYWSLEGN